LTRRPRGKKPKKGWKGKRADNLARFSSAWNQQTWHGVSLARLTLDNQEWEVRAGQVYLLRRGELSERTYWLIVAHQVATGEIKYFISNAPPETPIEKLLRVVAVYSVEKTAKNRGFPASAFAECCTGVIEFAVFSQLSP
jgi:hypothetical protein